MGGRSLLGRLENSRNYRQRLKLKEYSEYGIIYKATCIINNKVYIGQTIRSLSERKAEHQYKGLFYFHNALKKYGEDNFLWQIIDTANDQIELDRKEITWIQHLNSTNKNFGYNLTLGGDHPSFNEEVRKRISENMMGVKNHRYGIKTSDKTRSKMSVTHLASKRDYTPNMKKIKCNETGEIFPSLNAVNEKTGVPLRTLNYLLRDGNVSPKHKLSFIKIINKKEVCN